MYNPGRVIPDSSMVEHLTVNQGVPGSSPGRGANIHRIPMR